MLRRGGAAAHVAGSQVALAASNYVVLAIAARHLDPAGFAAVSAYYLLINTVGRGLFAAVELETTRAVAAGAHGHAGRAAAHRRAARRRARPARARRAAAHRGGPGGHDRTARRRGGHDGGVLPHPRARSRAAALRPLRRHVLDRGGGRAGGGGGARPWSTSSATTAWIAVLALAPGVAPAAALAGAAWRPRGRGAGAARAVVGRTAAGRAGRVEPRPRARHRAPRRRPDARRRVHHRRGGRARAGAAVPDDPGDAAPRLAAGGARPPGVPGLPQGDTAATEPEQCHPAAAHPRPPRVLVGGIAAAGLVWVVVAAVAVPWVAALVFATTAPPPTWVVAVLALSTVLGALAQVVQAQLVAVRRTHAAALAWLVGLGVLLVVGLVAADRRWTRRRSASWRPPLVVARRARRRRGGAVTPTVGVVVLAWRDEPYLRECVAAVLASTGVDVRLVVVDNGCRPEDLPTGRRGAATGPQHRVRGRLQPGRGRARSRVPRAGQLRLRHRARHAGPARRRGRRGRGSAR